MGRPTKYTPERADKIISYLKVGSTRKAAYDSACISYDTFYAWLKRYPGFSEAVTRAESDAEIMFSATIAKAANGVDSVTSTRTVKTIAKTKVTKFADGTVVEEPVPFTEITDTTVTTREFDWRAAESWLKRRRKEDWGDKQDITTNGDAIHAPVIVLRDVSMSDL